jgi:hypothetical protein
MKRKPCAAARWFDLEMDGKLRARYSVADGWLTVHTLDGIRQKGAHAPNPDSYRGLAFMLLSELGEYPSPGDRPMTLQEMRAELLPPIESYASGATLHRNRENVTKQHVDALNAELAALDLAIENRPISRQTKTPVRVLRRPSPQ